MRILTTFFLSAALCFSSRAEELHIRQKGTVSPLIRISAPDDVSVKFEYCIVTDASYRENIDCELMGGGIYRKEELEDAARRYHREVSFRYGEVALSTLFMLFLLYTVILKINVKTVLQFAVPKEIVFSTGSLAFGWFGVLSGLVIAQPGYSSFKKNELLKMLDVRPGTNFFVVDVPYFSRYKRVFESLLNDI